MSEPIFQRSLMRARGRAAFQSGQGRDDHGMNPGAAAIEDWQAGWEETAGGSELCANDINGEAAA